MEMLMFKWLSKCVMMCVISLFFMGQGEVFAQKTKSVQDNISISVSEDDDYFTYSASFHPNKTEKVKSAIVGVYHQAAGGQNERWMWSPVGSAEIVLKKGYLSMHISKKSEGKAQVEKMKNLGETVKSVLDMPQTPASPDTP